MEFINDKGDKLYINNECTYIEINTDRYKVVKKSLFTEKEGKLETEEYNIRYSKDILYMYNKEHNIVDTYKFSKFVIVENKEEEIINKFILKENEYIELYKTSIKYKGEMYKIKEKYDIGNDKEYKTEKGDILHVSTRRNNKWNGIPIGKIN